MPRRAQRQLKILYIPGLGDRYDRPLRIALKFWRLYGVRTEFVSMRWRAETSFDAKYKRVLAATKRAEEQGYRVVLIGASAGSSMALNVLATSPTIEHVVTICGVNSPDTPVDATRGLAHPGFLESLSELRESLKVIDRSKVTVLYSRHDHVVPRRYTLMSGASQRRVPCKGHLMTIALTMTIYAWIPISISKMQHRLAK